MDYSKYSDRELLLEILKRLDKQDKVIAKLKTGTNRKNEKVTKDDAVYINSRNKRAIQKSQDIRDSDNLYRPTPQSF